jgi:hypothetical protein
VRYYDEAGLLVNTLECSNIKQLGGRLLPATMTMIPSDKDKHKTVMTYSDIIFDKDIPDSFFSVNAISTIQ